MIRRRTRSLSPERVDGLEEPKVSWRNVARQLLTMEDNLAKVQARLRHFDGLIAGHKAQLAGDEDSLPVARVARIARQFRADARQYSAALEDVLAVLGRGNVAMSAALYQEEGGQLVLSNSDDELRLQRRVRVSRLLVAYWLRGCREQRRTAAAAPLPPPSSFESSSSQSDMGSGIAPKKKHRRPWFKPPKREVPSDWTSEKEDADEESGGVTEEVPPGYASSSGDGDLAALFSRLAVGRSSSEDGDAGAAAAASSRDSDAGEGPEGQGDSPGEANVTLYRSATSSSCLSFHSATSGDEADCEPETTSPAVSTTTESSNGSSGNPSGETDANGNVADEGNRNANRNGRVRRQSTGSHTDESWVARDRVELCRFDRQSPWSAMHELCRQHGLLRLQLRQHAQRLESLRLARPHLHLLSPEHPLRASRLLRAQLRRALRTVASEVHAVQHALHLRLHTLRLFAKHVWHSPPQ